MVATSKAKNTSASKNRSAPKKTDRSTKKVAGKNTSSKKKSSNASATAKASSAKRATAEKPNASDKNSIRTSKPDTNPERLELFKRFIRENHDKYLKDPNITSVGIGYKIVDGKISRTPVVQFSVEQKVAPESIGGVSDFPIPSAIEYEGVQIPTDVVQRNFKPSYQLIDRVVKDERKVRNDPITPGISVSHFKSTAGTLGALVRNRQTGDVVMLSNWHVFHTSQGKIGDAIVQPGPHDDNRVESNRVGSLLRSHLGLAGDCAIASIEGRRFDEKFTGLGVPLRRLAKPQLGDTVVKSGRTTAVTYGIVSRIETITKLDYGDGVSAQIGGFEIGPDARRPAELNEISKGGDSGSVWLATSKKGAPTDVAIGLHFAGETEDSDGEYALACCAHAVFEKLEIDPLRPTVAKQGITSFQGAESELRTGFKNDFLQFEVPDPRFEAKIGADLARLHQTTRIDYCHFSVWLSKSRKFPRVVAWSIDGSSIKKLGRAGIPFALDDRGGLDEYQIGEELYYDNPLDRGHIARRADLCWGPMREAKLANEDSFYFTNIAPQHQRFNQGRRGGLWGQLEDAIFDDVKLADLRVSLFGGPIMRQRDPLYRDIARVPREFWKIVAYTDAADDQGKVRAFILTQSDLVRNLGPEVLELDEFHWYQVPISRIERETGVRFSKSFKDLDAALMAPESIGSYGARRIDHASDFFA